MFGLFSGERASDTYSTSRDEASDAASRACPHQHQWTLTNFSRGVAVRRHVRRQRFASKAAVRRAGKERGRHFSVVERFVAVMGVPRAFRTDNGTEYSNSIIVDLCNGLGIRREVTTPYTSQRNGTVESAISRVFKAGHAARLGAPQLYPDIRLKEIRDCTGRNEPLAGVATLGIGVLQQGGNISGR